MAKFYAVAKGKSGEGKIYTSWDECKKEVIGFKGAIYKSFPSEEEAKRFISVQLGDSDSEICCNNNINEGEEGLVIYVDGSFHSQKENFSYGLVALNKGEVIFEDNGVGEEKEASSMRNVAGEVLGAMKAIEFTENNGYKEVNICFDYQGIESWAKGTWNRNNFLTQRYHSYMQEKMKNIKINFKKIKGHSGDKYNDRADELAKKALGI